MGWLTYWHHLLKISRIYCQHRHKTWGRKPKLQMISELPLSSQRVIEYESCKTELLEVKCGASQGLILGALPFLFYMVKASHLSTLNGYSLIQLKK